MGAAPGRAGAAAALSGGGPTNQYAPDRVKVVVIAGAGRSGSTLLSLLLSQHTDTFNLGQSRDLWRAYAANEPCTCGAALPDCPVWGEVARRMFDRSTARRMEEVGTDLRRFMKDAASLDDWTSDTGVARLVERHEALLRHLSLLIRHAAAVTGATSFVDISKSPEVALAYRLAPGVHLKVLNLVRDPRAVASSWEKRSGRTAAVAQAGGWIERQERIDSWAGALGGDLAVLRYEDLTSRPRWSIGALLGWAGLDAGVELFTDEHHAEISWTRQHLFPPANERVLAEQRTSIHIVEATAWREEGDRALHAEVESACGPVMERLGYEADERRAASAASPLVGQP